ncbi:MAG: peptidoglycan DD-metalloendopeptidase family protein [Alphaproteobacteria bacterium GM7ARS4]|nr:peptidoglycan DD-metalloendopeptidase family protein [Alphaproteobacteria bacterium GM7ARS4]
MAWGDHFIKKRGLFVVLAVIAAVYSVFQRQDAPLPLPSHAYESLPPRASLVHSHHEAGQLFNARHAAYEGEEDGRFSTIKRSNARMRIITTRYGDNLYGILHHNDVDSATADLIIKRLRPVFHIQKLKAGSSINIVFAINAAGDIVYPHRVELTIEGKQRVGVARLNNGDYRAYKRTAHTTRTRYRAEGSIYRSFVRSLRQEHVPASVTEEAIAALSYDIDFQREIQRGNNFQLTYDIIRDRDTNSIIETQLMTAKLQTEEKNIAIYRFDSSREFLPFYKTSGESVVKSLSRTPLNGAYISSSFGIRKDPIVGYTRLHKGVDFAAPVGTPVFAAGDGVVVEATSKEYPGNYIKIKHNAAYSTLYAHLSGFAIDIEPGINVKQGQVIGYVGNTGYSTGPHLHYEVQRYHGNINPLLLSLPSTDRLQGDELRRFQNLITAYNQEYDTLDTIASLALGGSE